MRSATQNGSPALKSPIKSSPHQQLPIILSEGWGKYQQDKLQYTLEMEKKRFDQRAASCFIELL